MKATPGAVRGCGTRTEGGLYLEVGTSPFGKPLEYFLADPPVPYEPDVKTGQQLVQRGDTYHVVDWVGETYYPYPADVLEEGRRLGFSRKISPNLELELLSEESRLVLVHPKGAVTNPEQLQHDTKRLTEAHGLERYCMIFNYRDDDLHIRRPDGPCSRLHWIYAPPTHEETMTREVGSTEYRVYPPYSDGNWNVVAPDYAPAVIASLPISRFAVIRAEDGSHQKTAEKVKGKLRSHDLGLEDA